MFGYVKTATKKRPEKNKDLDILLKPRFVGNKDEGVHYSSTGLKSGNCSNITITEGNCPPSTLIKNAHFLFGLSTTNFIEAIYALKLHRFVFPFLPYQEYHDFMSFIDHKLSSYSDTTYLETYENILEYYNKNPRSKLRGISLPYLAKV